MAAALRAQLNAHLASMHAQGVVDEETFGQPREVGSAVEVANTFLDDAQIIIDDIEDMTGEPVVHFEDVTDLVLQLMECTSSVGAKNMKLACMHFGSLYAMESNEGCLLSLALVKNEFCLLRNNFETMIKLEEWIAAYDPK